MKSIILVLVVAALASAAPKSFKPHFHNLHKKPINEIQAKPNPHIIGGSEAQPHQFPYQAFLEVYSADEGWYCSGSLISEYYVLTAGHCGYGAKIAYVTLGAHTPFKYENSQELLISRDIKVHEDFDLDSILNDISVIKLQRAISFKSAIQPVALPPNTTDTYEGSIAIVSGWGLIDGASDYISDVLNYVEVEIISNKKCGDVYGQLPDSTICTSGSENRGICGGDSGGPLVLNGVQVGIVSFGVEGCLNGYPSAYTRVNSFWLWIHRMTGL